MPRVRAPSARTNERGVGLGDMEGLRNFPDFDCSESRLNRLQVAFLSQPTRQAGRVPPSVRDRVIAELFGNLLFRSEERRVGKEC